MSASHAFGRERRLRKRGDFLRVQATGLRVTSPRFVFLVARQPGEGGAAPAPSRLGLVVSRKVGGAVRRNLVKRLCRECFRQLPDFVPPGIDLVVIAKPDAARGIAFAEVQREWSKARPAIRRRVEEALALPPGRHHVSARSSSPAGPPPRGSRN